MTFAIRDVAKYALDTLPGVPVPLLQRLAVEGIRDFCKISRVWKLWLGPFDIDQDVADYELAPLPTDAVICDVVRARINYTPDEPKNAVDIYPYSEQGTYPVRPYTYNRALGNYISLRPTPCDDREDFLEVEVALMPAINVAECVADIIWDEHLETIYHYIAWKAMTRPGQTYTDLQLGPWHGEQYGMKAQMARQFVRSGNMEPRHRTIGNDFG